VGIEALSDFVKMDIDMAEESAAWRQLSAADKQAISKLFGRRPDTERGYVEQAKKCLHALCHRRMFPFSMSEQMVVMSHILADINLDHDNILYPNVTNAAEVWFFPAEVAMPHISWQ